MPSSVDAPALSAPAGALPGLRERKKRETARAIEVAAVELAAEHPLSDVTVEAISARADVTSRTFFNYYASKEDAVLGISKAVHPPTLAHIALVPGASVLETVVLAARDQFAAFDFGSPEFQRKRRAVIVANPSLLVKDFQTIGVIEDDLAREVERLLHAADLGPASARRDQAWAIVMFVGSVFRFALHTWSHETRGRRPLADHILEAYETMLSVGRSGP
jgi:AcrR family transcriptional regulator